MPSTTHVMERSGVNYVNKPLGVLADVLQAGDGELGRFKVTSAVLMIIPALLVVLRLWCRHFLQFGIRSDDWLVVAGLIFTLLTMGCFHISTEIDQAMLARVSFRQHQLFWLSLSGHLYPLAMALVKLSVFAMYYRVFPTEFMRQAFRIISVPVMVWMVVFELLQAFKARPFASRWDATIVGVNNIDESAFLTWQCVIETGLDILGFTHVIAATWQLQVSLDRKLKIIGIFMLGCPATITSILRIPYVVAPLSNFKDQADANQGPTPDLGADHQLDAAKTVLSIMTWLDVHLCMSVVCSCLPTLAAHVRMVLKKFGIVKSAGIWHHHNLIGGTHNVGQGHHITNHSYDDIPDVPSRKTNTIYQGTDSENRTRSTLRSIYGDQPIPIELQSCKRGCSRGFSPCVEPSDAGKEIKITIRCPKSAEVASQTVAKSLQEGEGHHSPAPACRSSNVDTIHGTRSIVSGTDLKRKRTNDSQHPRTYSQNFSKPFVRRPIFAVAPISRILPERPYSGQTSTTRSSVDSLWRPICSRGVSPPENFATGIKPSHTASIALVQQEPSYTVIGTHTQHHTTDGRNHGWCSPGHPPPTRPLPTPTGSPRNPHGIRQSSVERGRRMQRGPPPASLRSSSAFNCQSSWFNGDEDDDNM